MNIFWIILPQLAGIVGSVFTVPNISTWYESLIQPSFRPPNWVFAPVWTMLYFMMGIAAYRVRVRGGAVGLFIVQLVLNTFWSILFFHFHAIGPALLEIVVLWGFIFVTMLRFFRIDRLAGYLFIPYIVWVTFAGLLNFTIWYLNH